MINFDFKKYAENNWNEYLETITDVSMTGNGVVFVESEEKIYNFDKINDMLFVAEYKPASVDGIYFRNDEVFLVEFKTGFYQKIRKDNLNSVKAKCEFKRSECADYWNLFFENQERKIGELISSIKQKAIESYVTINEDIAPFCKIKNSSKFNLVVVIDVNENEQEVGILEELTGKDSFMLSRVRRSLKRFMVKKRHLKSYYFDNISVFGAESFLKYINKQSLVNLR